MNHSTRPFIVSHIHLMHHLIRSSIVLSMQAIIQEQPKDAVELTGKGEMHCLAAKDFLEQASAALQGDDLSAGDPSVLRASSQLTAVTAALRSVILG